MTMDTTVIIPTFNRRPFLREALNSVRAQICSPKTTIVIDDGGEDESWKEIPQDSPEFNYFYQTNSGVSSARNLGVKHSATAYISFLDSDDLWGPHFLQVHQKVFQLFPDIGCIMSDFVLTDLEGEAKKQNQGFSGGFPIFSETGYDPVGVFGASLEKKVLVIDDARYDVFAGDVYELLFLGNFFQPSGTSVKRAVFESLGGFNVGFQVAEDTEFYHRLSAFHHVAIVLAPLYKWRIGHASSLISSENTLQSILNARSSLQGAKTLRPATTTAERNFRMGIRSLEQRLCYYFLARLETQKARYHSRKGMKENGVFSVRFLSIYLLSFLPARMLRLAGDTKRWLKKMFLSGHS